MPTSALSPHAPLQTGAATARHAHAASQTVTRSAALDDFDAVNELHERCSLQTRFARYLAARRSLSLSEFVHLTRPDRSLTWVTHPKDDPDKIIATMNLVRTAEANAAELGIMIEDAWQSRGLGTSLVQFARTQARGFGCSSIVVLTSSDNVRVLKIMRSLGRLAVQGSTVDFTVCLG